MLLNESIVKQKVRGLCEDVQCLFYDSNVKVTNLKTHKISWQTPDGKKIKGG